MDIFRIMGALGLALISIGILTKKRERQDVFYIFGGLFLGAYSSSIKDFIFISLQVIFTIAAIYDLVKIKFFKK